LYLINAIVIAEIESLIKQFLISTIKLKILKKSKKKLKLKD